jgi:protein CpxP
MKYKLLSTLMSAAFLLAGTAAYADPGCDQAGPHHGGWKGARAGDPKDIAARLDKHLARFKDELKITPQQEALWTAYADKVKAGAETGLKTMRERFADAKMSAVERMERMESAMKERLAAMDAATESFKRLYASLSPEQRTAADNHMSRLGHHWQREHGEQPAPPPDKG